LRPEGIELRGRTGTPWPGEGKGTYLSLGVGGSLKGKAGSGLAVDDLRRNREITAWKEVRPGKDCGKGRRAIKEKAIEWKGGKKKLKFVKGGCSPVKEL